MKLKNSYILLIAMALFLLISIGSVCASENVTADTADEALASTDGDIEVPGEEISTEENTLVNTEENTLGNTEDAALEDIEEPTLKETGEPQTTEKIDTTINVISDTEKFAYDAEKNLTVSVKDNNSQEITNIAENELNVLEGNKSIGFTYNNSKIGITDKLPVGTHNLTIKYLGNINYTESSTYFLLKIFGNNTLNVPETVVSDGTNVKIDVSVFDGVDNLTLDESKFRLNLTYIGDDGNKTSKMIDIFTLENGKLSFEADVKLLASTLTINYTDAVEPKTVAIVLSTKINTTSEVRINEADDKNITVTVLDGKNNPVNITKSDLKVFENGTNVEFDYNNSTMTINGLSIGNHNLTINYLGNANYTNATANLLLKIFGAKQLVVDDTVYTDGEDVIVPVKLFDGADYYKVIKENFTLTLTYTNATGNVTSKEITEFSVDDNGTITFNPGVKLVAASLKINYTEAAEAKTTAIKIITAIDATSPIEKRDTDNKTFKIYVLDGTGFPITVTKNDLKVLENGKTLEFTYNNTVITIKSLAIGKHNLTIMYNGNETYNASSKEVIFNVRGNATLKTPASAIIDKEQKVNLTVNLTDGVDPVPISRDNLTITLFYKVGNNTYNRTIEGSSYDIDGQSLILSGIIENFTEANVIIKYHAENLLTGTTALKMSTETNVSDLRKGQSEAKEIPIDVTGVNWGAINITAKDLKVFVNGKETTKFTYNNSVITLTDAYKAGIYNLTIKYLGNSLFVASDKNIILTVYGINATTSRDVNSSKKVENITVKIIDGNNTIDVTLDDLNITVTYKDGNKTVDIVIKNTALNNGTLSFELENGNFTTATLSIRYNNTVTNVTLNRIYNVKIIPINTVNEYRDGTFTFKLEDLDDKNVVPAGITVRLTTVGNIRAGFTTTTDKDGIATYKTVNLYTFNKLDSSSATQFNLEQEELYVGNHLVDVETEGKGKSKKISVNLTITPANFEIVVPNFSEYYQTNKNFTAYVVNKKSKTPMANIPVTFKIVNSENKEVTYTNGATKQKITTIYTNSEGKISLPVGNLVGGTYTYRLTVEKSHNYNKVSKKGTFEIKKIPVVINAKDVTVTYNSGTTSTIKITKNGKGISGVYFVVRLYITSKKYEDYLFLSGKNGKYSFSASLNVGKHKMIINSADSRYGAKQVTKTITVKKASATIKAKKVTDYYKGAKTFNVKLINSKTKKPIYNAKLKIKISDSKKYYTYTGNTGINGQLKLALSNINPGKYKVEITGADNKNFAAKKVTSKIVIKKAPTKLTPKKLKAKKGAKKYFKVKVTNKKTKKVMSGVKIKIKVYTGKKYKTYTVKSNKKGIAKISTKKLKVGKHKVVVTSANKYCVAKKAKSSIKITKK